MLKKTIQNAPRSGRHSKLFQEAKSQILSKVIKKTVNLVPKRAGEAERYKDKSISRNNKKFSS